MNKTVRLLTDVAFGLSSTAWVSGPLFEQYGLKPAIAKSINEADKEAIMSAYKAYSNVVHAGLAGLTLTNVFRFFGDDLRRHGNRRYRRWARVNDAVVLSIISVGAATRIMSKRLKKSDPTGSEAKQARQVLAVTSPLSIVLFGMLVLANAMLHRERKHE